MPDDAESPVGPGAVGLDRLRRGLADGEELVVLRALLGDLLVGDLERDEVADVGEETLFRKQSLDKSAH